jgi:UrcA family protein
LLRLGRQVQIGHSGRFGDRRFLSPDQAVALTKGKLDSINLNEISAIRFTATRYFICKYIRSLKYTRAFFRSYRGDAMIRFVAPVFIVAGLLTTAAYAGPAAPSAAVHYADLNITKDADAQKLIDRIDFAARKVCGAQPSFGNLHSMARWDECVTNARTRALIATNSATVYRLAGIKASALRVASDR